MGAFGVDPSTMQEMEMPPEGYEMDPTAGAPDPYQQFAGGDAGENELRERVEVCVLLAIETVAKAVEAGIGADNPEFAQAYGQTGAALGQLYESLTRSEIAGEKQELESLKATVDALFRQQESREPVQ